MRRGMEASPACSQDDAVVHMLQEAQLMTTAATAAAAAEDGGGGSGSGAADEESAAAGVRLIDSVRSLALLTMLRAALLSGAPPPLDVTPSLGDAAAATAAIGQGLAENAPNVPQRNLNPRFLS